MSVFQKNRAIGPLAALCFAFGLAASPAQAGGLSDLAAKIESNLAGGEAAASVAAARQLLDDVWAQVPLGFSAVVLTEGEASGFGVFNTRKNNIFKINEPIILYAEPYGFGYGDVSANVYNIAFDIDLMVKTEGGGVLGEVPNIMHLDLTTRRRNKEFHAILTYNLSGLVPGKYVLATTFKDKNSARSGSFETAIEIAK